MRLVFDRDRGAPGGYAVVVIDAEPAGFWDLTRLHITGASATKTYQATIFKAWRGPVTDFKLLIMAQHVLGTHLSDF